MMNEKRPPMLTTTDFEQAKKVHIKEIDREVRQGYTNQSVFRLLDIVSDLCFSAATSKDAKFARVAYEVADYARALRDFQKKVIGLHQIKERAKHLFEITKLWKENRL